MKKHIKFKNYYFSNNCQIKLGYYLQLNQFMINLEQFIVEKLKLYTEGLNQCKILEELKRSFGHLKLTLNN